MHNVEKWPNILKKCCGTFGHFSTLCKHFSTLCKKGLKQYFASYRLHWALYPVNNNHRVKSARIRSYSGPIFPHLDWIRTRITPNTDTFYAVNVIGRTCIFNYSQFKKYYRYIMFSLQINWLTTVSISW